jgi:recombination protein RecA
MSGKNARRTKRIIENVAGIFADRSIPHGAPIALNYKPVPDISTIPTGFRPLDKALGLGGLPCGKITELMGPGGTSPRGGPTSIAARIASKVQRKQQLVTIIDMRHSFDLWQAERSGLIAPHLLLSRPDTIFDALMTMENAARNEGLVVVVMGIVAELLSHATPDLLKTLLGRLRNIIGQSNSVFLFMTFAQRNDPFGSENYPAGFPLAELADVRLWIQDETWTHKDGTAIAYKANLTVIKNRLAIAGKGADIKIKFTVPQP